MQLSLPYSLPLFLAAAVALALAGYVRRARNTPGSTALTFAMVGAAIWALADALGVLSGDLATRILWSKASYLGAVVIPTAWLAFAVSHTGRPPLGPRALAVLAIEPVVTLLAVWTNESRGLVWSRLEVVATEPFIQLRREYGDWFWVHTVYSYVLLAVGAYLLIAMALRLRRTYRQQSAILLLAVLIPWVGNALYLLRISPLPYLDLTPFTFIATGLVLALGLFRLDVLDMFPGLIPVARDAVVEAMSDGVLVVDRRGRVIDLNSAACRLLHCTEAAIGESADGLVPSVARPHPLVARTRLSGAPSLRSARGRRSCSATCSCRRFAEERAALSAGCWSYATSPSAGDPSARCASGSTSRS